MEPQAVLSPDQALFLCHDLKGFLQSRNGGLLLLAGGRKGQGRVRDIAHAGSEQASGGAISFCGPGLRPIQRCIAGKAPLSDKFSTVVTGAGRKMANPV